jgi:hypothetical protein
MRATKSLPLAPGLSLLSLSAVAAVQPGGPPDINAEVREAVLQEERVLQPFPEVVPMAGPWERRTFLDPVIVNDRFTVGPSLVPMTLSLAGIPPGALYNQRKVALRINDGLDHIGRDVVPAVADEFGLDHIEIIDSLTIWSEVGDCNTYRLKLRDVSVDLPFGTTSVTGHFESGRKVLSDFNLPAADAHAELEFTITNTSNSGWCFFDIIPAMDIESSYDAGDLDGNLDVTLERAGDAIQVDTIDDIELTVADFAWDTNSWFLDTIIDLGFWLYDLFDFTCSGQADCLTEAVNQYALADDGFLDQMTALVNDAIDAPLTISTGTSTDGLALNFTINLSSLKSSTTHDTMTSIWNATLTSSAATDSCAAALSARAFAFEGGVGDAQLTADDLELEIPFHLLTKAAYFAGKQGLYCQSGTYSVIPGVPQFFKVVPDGAVSVAKGGPADPDNLIQFTLPVEVTASGGLGGGAIAGTLTVKGTLSVDGGSDVVFTTTSADASGLSGSIMLGGIPISAATLEPSIDAAVAGIVSDMNDLELLNAVVNTGIGGLGVSASDVTTNGQALVIGLNFD